MDARPSPVATVAPVAPATLSPRLLALGLLAFASVAGLAWTAYRPVDGFLDAANHFVGRDFVNPWAAAHLMLDGKVDGLADREIYWQELRALTAPELEFHNWSYPPHSLFLFAPLGFMSYGVALMVWSLLGLGLFCWAAFPSGRAGHRRAAPGDGAVAFFGREAPWGALALLVLAPASIVNLASGQNGFFTAALLIGAFRIMDRRPLLAGLLLALLTVKPHLGLTLPLLLLVLQRWRVLSAAAAGTTLLVGLSVAAFGLDPWRDYFIEVSGYQSELLQLMQGFFAAVMMPGIYAGLRGVGLAVDAALAIHAICAVAMVVLACVAIRRARHWTHRAGIAAFVAFLATPYAYNYEMTAISAVLVWWAFDRPTVSKSVQIAALLIWVAPYLSVGLWGAVTPALAMALGVGAVAYMRFAMSQTEARQRASRTGRAYIAGSMDIQTRRDPAAAEVGAGFISAPAQSRTQAAGPHSLGAQRGFAQPEEVGPVFDKRRPAGAR